MTGEPVRLSALAIGLSILGPLLVLSTLVPWALPVDEADVVVRGRAAEIEEDLAETLPDVVILGSSIAQHIIPAEPLAEAMGDPELAVVNAYVLASAPPTWYGVLKNRVYDNGHRPRVVIVVDMLTRMFKTSPQSDKQRQELLNQMAADDDVILEKAFGEELGAAWLNRLRQRRNEFRTRLLEVVKNRSIRVLFRADADEALDEVFGEGRVDRSRATRIIPIVEVPEEAGVAEVLDLQQSFVPDLARLASEHGSKLIFVRAALPPSTAVNDSVDPEFEVEAITLFNELGVGWVDLRTVGVAESDFTDRVHINEAGMQKMVGYLGPLLSAWDVLGDTPLPSAPRPLRPSRMERTGAPPTLEPTGEPKRVSESDCAWWMPVDRELQGLTDKALARSLGAVGPVRLLQDGVPLPDDVALGKIRAGCVPGQGHVGSNILFTPTGGGRLSDHTFTLGLAEELPVVKAGAARGWWIYPGTTLALHFDEPFSGDSLSVEVVAQAATEGRGVPTLTVQDTSLPLEQGGALFRGQVEQPSPDGPWSIGISVPAEGPYVALRLLAVGRGASAQYLVGNPNAAAVDSMRFIGVVDPERDQAVALFTTPPPEIRSPRVQFKGNEGFFKVSRLAGSRSLQALQDAAGLRYCTPYQVLEDGVPIRGQPGRCKAMRNRRGVSVCALAERDMVFFRLLDGRTPSETGSEFTLALHPERRCGYGRLILPGDSMRYELDTGKLLSGADGLELSGQPVGPPGDATVDIRVSTQGLELVRETVPMSRFQAGSTLEWAFRGRVPRGAQVRFEASTAEDAPWLNLSVAALVTARPFEELELLEAPAVALRSTVIGVDAPPLAVTFAAAAPELAKPKIKTHSNRWGAYARGIAALAGVDPITEAPCASVRLLEDGAELAAEQVRGWMIFTPAGGEDPTTSGRTYTLALGPDRRCGDSMWLYDRDEATLAVPDELEAGTHTLVLTALLDARKPPTDAPLEVAIRRGEDELLRTEVGVAELDGAAVRVPFTSTEATKGLPDPELSVVLVNRGRHPILVSQLGVEAVVP